MEERHSHNIWLIPLLVIVILVGLGLFLARLSDKEDSSDVVASAGGNIIEMATVGPDGQLRPIEGFPTDIPIEASLFESFKVLFTDTGIEQYTVGYNSTAAVGLKWQEYLSYMQNAGYNISEEDTDENRGILYGKDDGRKGLLTIVTTEDGRTVVQVSFFKK